MSVVRGDRRACAAWCSPRREPPAGSRFRGRAALAMTAPEDDYYDGSRTFSWLADYVGVPIDQVGVMLAAPREPDKRNRIGSIGTRPRCHNMLLRAAALEVRGHGCSVRAGAG